MTLLSKIVAGVAAGVASTQRDLDGGASPFVLEQTEVTFTGRLSVEQRGSLLFSQVGGVQAVLQGDRSAFASSVSMTIVALEVPVHADSAS
jgi:hypothetical protein